MIKELRRKFIMINMALISLVLLMLFATILISNSHRLQLENREALQRALEHNLYTPPPKPEIGRFPLGREHLPFTPVFTVLLDNNLNLLFTTLQNVSIADDDLSEAIGQALASKHPEGTLEDLNLRYLRQDSSKGIKIAFADRSNEIQSMHRLLLIFLIVGAGSLAAFFLISFYLAGWALRPAEKAWEQQRQFVADASHELKMPLTVILANSSILLDHRQDYIAQQSKWVKNTRAEALRMKKLVDDLLFLAKSDADRAPLVHTQLNFSDLVWGFLLPLEAVAYERDVTINANIDPEVTLSGNEGQLKQLVGILLDNACKYAGEKGFVTVTLARRAKKVCLNINNTGTIIPPEDLPHIFERFYRAEKSRARDLGGYGLGLAIAKSIADNHQAKITAASTAEQGTTFKLHFADQ